MYFVSPPKKRPARSEVGAMSRLLRSDPRNEQRNLKASKGGFLYDAVILETTSITVRVAQGTSGASIQGFMADVLAGGSSGGTRTDPKLF